MKINWFKIQTNEIIDNIEKYITLGVLERYITFLIYLKQGPNCKDCGKYYSFCKCNFCENCNQKYCICNIKKDYMKTCTNLVRFTRHNLAKNGIADVIFKLNTYAFNLILTNREKKHLKHVIEALEYEN